MKTPTTAFFFLLLGLGSPLHVRSATLTFEDLVGVPDHSDFINLDNAIALTFPGQDPDVYGGVRWSFSAVANSNLVANSQHASDYWVSDGTGPFVTPHSGANALFVPLGQPLELSTDQILTGVWVARPNLGPTGVGGAERLRVTALAGDTPLASLSIDLTRTGTTPVFWDTSAFLFLTGVTRYLILPAQPGQDSGYFVADDFTFATDAVGEVCPCVGPWRNRAEYVRCVRAAASLLQDDGALTHAQARETIKAAQKSDCGSPSPRP
jgi:hypothetical protein